MKKHARFWLSAGVLLCASALLAYDVGDRAYTKKLETNLLEEPKALAHPVVKLSFAVKLNVEQVNGAWLLVSAGDNRGWVFAGNVTAEKPSKDRKTDFLPSSASATTTSIAARPLDEVAKNYGDQKGLGEAKADVEWVEQQSAQVNDAAVTAYLQTKKLGEYK
jgi:SH3-like domain-containing protein